MRAFWDWLTYMLKAFIRYLPISFLLLISIFMYSSLVADCRASNALQAKMRKELSKKELESVRPSSGVCPSLFFYKSDDGPGECAKVYTNFLLGIDISIGGCG